MEMIVSQAKTVASPSPICFYPEGTRYTLRYGTIEGGDEKNVYPEFYKKPLFVLSAEDFKNLFNTRIVAGKIYIAEVDINIVYNYEKISTSQPWITRCKKFKRSKTEVDIYIDAPTRKVVETTGKVHFFSKRGKVGTLPAKTAEKIIEETLEEGMAVPVIFKMEILQDIR